MREEGAPWGEGEGAEVEEVLLKVHATSAASDQLGESLGLLEHRYPSDHKQASKAVKSCQRTGSLQDVWNKRWSHHGRPYWRDTNKVFFEKN